MGKRFKEFIIALSGGKLTRNSLYDEQIKLENFSTKEEIGRIKTSIIKLAKKKEEGICRKG